MTDMTLQEFNRMSAKVYAKMRGYFWLPCDWCGFEFGGHEKGWKSVPVGSGEPLLCFRCAPNWETGNPRVRYADSETVMRIARRIAQDSSELLNRLAGK